MEVFLDRMARTLIDFDAYDLFSLIGLVLKLGAIAIAIILVVGIISVIYLFITDNLMSPLCVVTWLGLTISVCVFTWNATNHDFIAILIQALFPAAVSYIAGSMADNRKRKIGQYIAVFVGYGIAYLLSLLISKYLSDAITILFALGLIGFVGNILGLSSMGSRSSSLEQELKETAHHRTLDFHEMRKLNRLTRNRIDFERDRALDAYNKSHPNDRLQDTDVE